MSGASRQGWQPQVVAAEAEAEGFGGSGNARLCKVLQGERLGPWKCSAFIAGLETYWQDMEERINLGNTRMRKRCKGVDKNSYFFYIGVPKMIGVLLSHCAHSAMKPAPRHWSARRTLRLTHNDKRARQLEIGHSVTADQQLCSFFVDNQKYFLLCRQIIMSAPRHAKFLFSRSDAMSHGPPTGALNN